MNCYAAEFTIYGTQEVSADFRDWRDPEHRSYTRRRAQDVSVCIYADSRERALVFAEKWEVPSGEDRCQLDDIDKVKFHRLTCVEEDCDVEYEGYDPDYDEYELLPED